MFGRSQQPRPDRFQDLLQRQTRSFFCLKVDGQDEQVCERAQGKVMMKATLGSSLKVIQSQIIFGTLEILFNVQEPSQEGRLGGEKRTQAEMIGTQFILEFVNAALYASSAVIIAPDFQHGIGSIGDKDSEHIAW